MKLDILKKQSKAFIDRFLFFAKNYNTTYISLPDVCAEAPKKIRGACCNIVRRTLQND